MARKDYSMSEFVKAVDNQTLQLHSITEDYPEMDEEEKQRLTTDILETKIIRQPLLAIKDKEKDIIWIYDGRNRFNVLAEMRSQILNNEDFKDFIIPIEIEDYKDDGELRIIADSYNLSRRHLNPMQKAIIAFSARFDDKINAIIEEKNKRKKKQSDEQGTEKTKAIEEIAALVGTNKEYIQQWKNIHDFYKDANDPQGKEQYKKISEEGYKDQAVAKKFASLFRGVKKAKVDEAKVKEMCGLAIAEASSFKPQDLRTEFLGLDKPKKKTTIQITIKTSEGKFKFKEKQRKELQNILVSWLEQNKIKKPYNFSFNDDEEKVINIVENDKKTETKKNGKSAKE